MKIDLSDLKAGERVFSAHWGKCRIDRIEPDIEESRPLRIRQVSSGNEGVCMSDGRCFLEDVHPRYFHSIEECRDYWIAQCPPLPCKRDTFNISELEEGRIYICDEHPRFEYRREGLEVQYRLNFHSKWRVLTRVCTKRTFRLKQKELRFSELNIGDRLLTDHAPPLEIQLIGFWDGRLAIFGVVGVDNFITRCEGNIKNWTKMAQ